MQRIYVEVLAEPQPNRTGLILHLVSDMLELSSREEAFTLRDSPLTVFVYTFDVPELDLATDSTKVEFRVDYSTAGTSCSGTSFTGKEIPVVMGTSGKC